MNDAAGNPAAKGFSALPDDADEAKGAAVLTGEPIVRGASVKSNWRYAIRTFALVATNAWQSAGWSALSQTTDGPVLQVVMRALEKITRDPPTMEALMTEVKRQRKIARKQALLTLASGSD